MRIKLKMLNVELKDWNKTVFGFVKDKKTRLMDELKSWDSIEEQRGLSREERCLRDLAKHDFANVVGLEEIKWKQKAKVQFLKEGDNNTNFFHLIALSRIH